MSTAYPMGDAYRAEVYLDQRQGGELTDKQRRRQRHKANGYVAKMARRGVKS